MMIPPISPRRIVRKCGHLHSAWRKSPVGDLCFRFHLWNRPGNWAEFRRQLEPQPGRSTDRRLESDRHTLRSAGSQSEDRAAVPENCRSRLLMLRTARKCARSPPSSWPVLFTISLRTPTVREFSDTDQTAHPCQVPPPSDHPQRAWKRCLRSVRSVQAAGLRFPVTGSEARLP